MMRISSKLDLEFHEFANDWPLCDDARLQEIANSIASEGQDIPIDLFEGRILDGRNRYNACILAGVEPKTREFQGTRHCSTVPRTETESNPATHSDDIPYWIRASSDALAEQAATPCGPTTDPIGRRSGQLAFTFDKTKGGE